MEDQGSVLPNERSNAGGFQTGGFPTFFSGGKVLIVLRTLSGIFLVGAASYKLRTGKDPSRKSPKKSWKSRKIWKSKIYLPLPNEVALNAVGRRNTQMSAKSGPEKGVITKGVFSLKESLESLNSLESLETGWALLYFPQSGGSLRSLESLNSLDL